MRDGSNQAIFIRENLNALRKHYPSIADTVQPLFEKPLENPILHDASPQTILAPQPGYNRYTVVRGMGNGVWISRFLLENTKRIYRLVVVESNPLRLAHAIQSLNLTPLLSDSRVRLYTEDWKDILPRILSAEIIPIATWGITAYSQSDGENDAANQDFQSLLLQNEAQAKEIYRMQLENGFQMQKNVIQNLPHIVCSHTLDAVYQNYTERPAIVIGAGPSLNKNIDALQHCPEGALLICTDTAFRLLLKRNIQPHIVVACDPTELNVRHFEAIDSLGNIVFAYLPETHHSILHKYRDHSSRLYLNSMNYKILNRYFKLTGAKHRFERGMNVGYCAFSLARMMGCSPIVLAGMDHALVPNLPSHADGTANQSDVEINETGSHIRLCGRVNTEESPLVYVDGYEGKPVPTFPYFAQVLQRFHKTVSSMNTPVINATEGGAKIAGAQQAALREVLFNLEPMDILQKPLLKNPALTVSKEFIPFLETLIQQLEHHHRQIQLAAKRVEEWEIQLNTKPPTPSEIQRQIEVLENRWNGILMDEPIQIGLDAALAKIRYEYSRTEPPEDLSDLDLALWWSKRYITWFQKLNKTLHLFVQEYHIVVESMKFNLTPLEVGR